MIMSTKLARALLAAAAVPLLAVPAFAHEYKLGPLVITHPWTRATPGGVKIAGGYLKITNNGTTADRLVGGSVATAAGFEVHEMAMEDGVMKMRALRNGLEIKPGETVELKPGGLHLMFTNLKRPLKVGEMLSGELRFEKAGTVAVEYKVEPLGVQKSDRHAH